MNLYKVDEALNRLGYVGDRSFQHNSHMELTDEQYENSVASESVTLAALKAALEIIEAEFEAKQYQRDRAAEYPQMADYLDGIVKGDQAQIDAYIAACQAVKAKYPKPE